MASQTLSLVVVGMVRVMRVRVFGEEVFKPEFRYRKEINNLEDPERINYQKDHKPPVLPAARRMPKR